MADASIHLQITRTGKPRRFKSVTAVVDWLSAEEEAWQPLIAQFSPYGGTSPASAAGQLIKAGLESLTSTTQQAGGTDDPSQLTALQNTFASHYGSTLIASETAAGRFVLEPSSHEVQAARYLALTEANRFAFHSSVGLSGGFWTGMAEGVLFRNGLGPAAAKKAADELAALATEHSNALTSLHDEQKQALDALYSAEEERLETLRTARDKQLELLLSKRGLALRRLTDHLRDATSAAKQQQADAEQAFGTVLADWDSRLTTWEDKLKQRLALEAPMSYWSGKSRRHRTTATIVGGAAMLASVSFGTLFLWLALSVVTTDQFTSSDYARILTLATVATLMIWALRILVRVLLSELHLRNDAEEREAMLKTFTALDANEDGARRLTDDDRRLLLASIFRPAATGIVSDDSAPFGLAEFLSRVNPRP